MAVAFYRMLLDARGALQISTIHRLFLETAGGIQQALTEGMRTVQDMGRRYLFLVHVQEENARLRRIIGDLHQQVTDLREAAMATKRLKELLDLKDTFPGTLLPAMVIGYDLHGWSQTIVLDKGYRDEVKEGMAVISPKGLVGQILESSAHFSRVMLLTDHNSEIAGITQRTRARGMIEGTGNHSCRMKYLHVSEDIQVGDTVVSSGVDRTYPKGILIGTITQVNKKHFGLFQEADLKLAVDLRTLEEAFVVLKEAEMPQ